MKLLGLFCLQISVILVLGRQVTLERSRGKDRRNKDKRDGVKRRDDDRKSRKEKWVVDSIYYDDYQSDGTGTEVVYDSCPPVPDVTLGDACADTCKSDTDCGDSYRCCFNGCAFTCLTEVHPAAVVDWRKEPRRARSGFSWLIPGRINLNNEAEPCSTEPVGKDEDPLLCPHGYFCHVDDNGGGKKKRKEGVCVKQGDDLYSPGEVDMVVNAALADKQICSVDGIVLLEGASMRLKDKHCRCKKGRLSCRKRKGQSDVDVKRKDNSKSKDKRERRRRKKGGKKSNSS